MATENSTLTQEYLHSLFDYKDGNLYWKNVSKFHNQLNKKIAGSLHHTGYVYIKIDNKKYSAHRLIFLYHHGYLPKMIDHIDKNSLNNNIDNLREANRFQNQWNTSLTNKSITKIKNVYWNKQLKKYSVQINAKNKRYYFGCFNDIELAELVAAEARNKYHKEFARHF